MTTSTQRTPIARGTGRDVLLEATAQLIGNQGLHAITLREVAGTAGLSLGSTTYHFADRDALLNAALTRVADNICQRCEQALPASDLAGKSATEIFDIVFAELRSFYSNITRTLAQVELYTEGGRKGEVAAISKRVVAAYEKLVSRSFVAAGLDQDQATKRANRVLVYVDGLALHSAANGTTSKFPEESTQVLHLLANTPA